MKDRFSGYAWQYAAFRPRYPQALYDFILSKVGSFDYAWDAGTGNGQAAEELAKHFGQVLATDISIKQLEQAPARPNIRYDESGELTDLPDKSVDLVTVAQAIHWLDRNTFYSEVKRVAKPAAIIAVWAYGLLKISSEVDPLINRFYTDVIGPYWDPERRLIDEQLETIEFPFEELPAPPFAMNFLWPVKELEGYLNTWSATQKYIRVNRNNPVPELIDAIQRIQPSSALSVEFPLFLRIGSVGL